VGTRRCVLWLDDLENHLGTGGLTRRGRARLGRRAISPSDRGNPASGKKALFNSEAVARKRTLQKLAASSSLASAKVPSRQQALLGRLRAVGADQQVNTLADRAARHADLSDPSAMVALLDHLRAAGAD
jgi:hypothetical protein